VISDCHDEEVNRIANLVNEFWHARVLLDGEPDRAERLRLADMADGIAADFDAEAAFYRGRAEYWRSGD
jgi:hypothetical protein